MQGRYRGDYNSISFGASSDSSSFSYEMIDDLLPFLVTDLSHFLWLSFEKNFVVDAAKTKNC